MDDHDEGEMPWESQAREAVEYAMRAADFDEILGAILIPPEDPQHQEGHFCKDAEAVQNALTEIYESEWVDNAPWDGGEVVFEPDATDTVDDAMRFFDVEEFFARIQTTFDEDDEEIEEIIVSASDLLAPGGSRVLRIDVEEINAELIRHLGANPHKMHDLSPRKFEELVAELFRAKGYDVELCRRGADGGVDIVATTHNVVGSALTLIQCKKYSSDNPVGVSVIRDLYGLVEERRATKGLVATTSSFTRPAEVFRDKVRFRMDLAEHADLVSFLNEYRRPPTGG